MRSRRLHLLAPLLCLAVGLSIGLAGCEHLVALRARLRAAQTAPAASPRAQATRAPSPSPSPSPSPDLLETWTFTGEIVESVGLVRVRRRGSPHFLYASDGFPLRQGDRVMTGEKSSATVSYTYGNTPIVVTLPALTFFVVQPSVPLPVLGQGRLMLTDTGPIGEAPRKGEKAAIGDEGRNIQSGGDVENTEGAGGEGPSRVGGAGLALLYQADEIPLGLPKYDLVLLGRKFPFRYVLTLPKPMPSRARALLRRERTGGSARGEQGSGDEVLIEVPREAASIVFVIPRPGEYMLQVFSVDGLARSRSYKIRARPPSDGERPFPLMPGRRVLLP